MSDQQLIYCETCKRHVKFETRTRQTQGERDGKSYRYRRQVALCPDCGAELDFSPYRQAAERAFEKACASDAGLITPEQIKELPRKYAIGKRPLSKLLGWGELTYTRLLDGNIPTPEHSAELLELLDDPIAFAQLLQRGYEQGVITKTALQRSMRAIRDMVGNQADAVKKVSAAADRLCILAEGDLTPSALQSLLYYAHGYSMKLLDEPLFDAQPIATKRGPEYQHIRKGYSFNNIQNTYRHSLDRARAMEAGAPHADAGQAAPDLEAPMTGTERESGIADNPESETVELTLAERRQETDEDIDSSLFAYPAAQDGSINEEGIAALYAKAEAVKAKKGKKSKKYKKALKAAMEAEALLRAQSNTLEPAHVEETSTPPAAESEPTIAKTNQEPAPAPEEQPFDREASFDQQIAESADKSSHLDPADVLSALESPLSAAEAAVIDRVYDQYGTLSGQALAMRIRSESPWRTARENAAEDGDSPIISRESMLAHFANLADLAI